MGFLIALHPGAPGTLVYLLTYNQGHRTIEGLAVATKSPMFSPLLKMTAPQCLHRLSLLGVGLIIVM